MVTELHVVLSRPATIFCRSTTGPLYPALLKLEQEGAIVSEWGVSDTNRKAKFYKLTRAGRRQLERETRDWEQATAILARFLSPAEEA